MSNKLKIFWICLLVVLAFDNVYAANNSDTSARVFAKSHEYKASIGDHAFILNSSIDDPFIISSLRINLGYASTLAQEISIPIDVGPIDTLYASSEMDYLLGNIKYKHKINDWAAFSVSMGALGRASTSFASLIFRGISTVSGFSLKWYFNVLKTKKSILTTTVAMSNNSYYYFNLKEYINDLHDSTLTRPASITQSYKSLTTNLGLSYALGLNEFFGLILNGHIGYGELPDYDFKNAFYGDLSIYFDINLIPLCDIPIGMSFGFTGNTYPEKIDKPDDISRIVDFKLSYNGNTAFNIGLEMEYIFIPEDDYFLINKIVQGNFVIELFF